jgi:predicted transcriptional regulator
MTNGTKRYPEAVMIRLSEADAERLRRAAEVDERPPSTLARKLVREGLERLQPAGSPDATRVR